MKSATPVRLRLLLGARCLPVVAAVAVLLATGVVAAHGVEALDYAGTLERVNVSSSGAQADLDYLLGYDTHKAEATPDGRYVCFSSPASTLVGGDTNGRYDVFVRDRVTGTTTMVSVSDSEEPSPVDSAASDITADGRKVVFQAGWEGFVSGDNNGVDDIFVRDLTARTTTRPIVAFGGGEPNADSFSPDITPDGRYIAFGSQATNLVATDTNAQRDIFVRDLTAGTTTLVSVSSDEAQSDGYSRAAHISNDGRYVAFASDATNLVDGDTNVSTDVFVRDLVAGTTTRVDVDSVGGEAANGVTSDSISMSGDGRYVTFGSLEQLVNSDTNSTGDVYIRDLQSSETTLGSVGEGGVIGDSYSVGGELSPDGEHVVFVSAASNFVAGNTTPAKPDVFVRDIQSGEVVLASVTGSGTGGNAYSDYAKVGDDGKWVLFESGATDLVSGDTNGKRDVFMAQAWSGTTLTLAGPASAPAYGAQVKLKARLVRTNGEAVSGESVIFERWTGSTWQSLGAAETTSTGYAVKYASGIKSKTTYRVRFVDSVPYRAAGPVVASVKPQVRLARSTSWKTLARYRTYYAKGFIAPKHSKGDSNKVKIRAYKKRSDGKYHYVKSFKASYSYYSSTKTRYRAAVKLTSKGSWKLVAYHAEDGSTRGDLRQC